MYFLEREKDYWKSFHEMVTIHLSLTHGIFVM